MTPELQRIRIAEAVGWKLEMAGHPFDPNARDKPKLCRQWHAPTGGIGGFGDGVLPDYLNDLNAMNAAEKMLTWEQVGDYWNHLMTIVSNQAKRPATEHSKDVWAFMSTAAQRAEAFLRTIGAWTPPQK